MCWHPEKSVMLLNVNEMITFKDSDNAFFLGKHCEWTANYHLLHWIRCMYGKMPKPFISSLHAFENQNSKRSSLALIWSWKKNHVNSDAKMKASVRIFSVKERRRKWTRSIYCIRDPLMWNSKTVSRQSSQSVSQIVMFMWFF